MDQCWANTYIHIYICVCVCAFIVYSGEEEENNWKKGKGSKVEFPLAFECSNPRKIFVMQGQGRGKRSDDAIISGVSRAGLSRGFKSLSYPDTTNPKVRSRGGKKTSNPKKNTYLFFFFLHLLHYWMCFVCFVCRPFVNIECHNNIWQWFILFAVYPHLCSVLFIFFFSQDVEERK